MKGGIGKPNPLSYVHIMIIRVNTVIQSHLSDTMIEMYTDSKVMHLKVYSSLSI
jgi:hypothetical protein